MVFEKIPTAETPNEKDESHVFDGISTPRIDTNRPGTDLHLEAHQTTSREINDSRAEETREEIIEYYGINKSKVISVPTTEGTKRKIRAFITVEKREEEGNGNEGNDEDEKYFSDGHAPHADLLRKLFKNFSELGELERGHKIPDDFLDKWVTKKGFIDPNADGFRSFPEIRFAFKKLILEKNENKLTKKEKTQIEDDSIVLPNWFTVGQQASS